MKNSPERTARLHRHHAVWVWLAVTVLTSSAAILTRYCRIPATSVGFWRVAGAALILAFSRSGDVLHPELAASVVISFHLPSSLGCVLPSLAFCMQWDKNNHAPIPTIEPLAMKPVFI
jgi:hypothetical protein